MHEVGHTRSVHRADHLLQTPGTFVRAPLPGMQGATAIIHMARAGGVGFTQYTAEFEPGGRLGPAVGQRFVYVLEGGLDIHGRSFTPNHYAYIPAQNDTVISAKTVARAAVIEKPYFDLIGVKSPDFLAGEESRVEAKAVMGGHGLQVRTLLPDSPAF